MRGAKKIRIDKVFNILQVVPVVDQLMIGTTVKRGVVRAV